MFENIAVAYCIPRSGLNEARLTDDSWIEIVLPFTDHAMLRESMVSSDGKTIKYGKLFELLDGLAAGKII